MNTTKEVSAAEAILKVSRYGRDYYCRAKSYKDTRITFKQNGETVELFIYFDPAEASEEPHRNFYNSVEEIRRDYEFIDNLKIIIKQEQHQ